MHVRRRRQEGTSLRAGETCRPPRGAAANGTRLRRAISRTATRLQRDVRRKVRRRRRRRVEASARGGPQRVSACASPPQASTRAGCVRQLGCGCRGGVSNVSAYRTVRPRRRRRAEASGVRRPAALASMRALRRLRPESFRLIRWRDHRRAACRHPVPMAVPSARRRVGKRWGGGC